MSYIGVFWWCKDHVIGKARGLAEGERGLSYIIDSPDTHMDLWEQHPETIQLPNALRELDYQEMPRGRVVFDIKAKQSIVYIDKSLLNDEVKAAISEFFQLKPKQAKWRKDPHYTVDPWEIGRLLEV